LHRNGSAMTVVKVSAPCRLHFGMFSFGHSDRPQFGGVGMMIEPPTVEVRISSADLFATAGSCDERVRDCVTRLVRAWNLESLPSCKIDVRSAASHVGLGVGTQLGLSIAAGLRRYLDLPIQPTESLAANVGRGLRSAVGTYGFREGGLIIDRGKLPGEQLGTLHRRLAIPDSWRIVLVRPPNAEGLSGNEEAQKFTALPAVPDKVTRDLWRLTSEEILPALEHGDCVAFGDAVYRFGWIAGECFAAAQGGPFASRTVERLVENIRDFGVTGVGQSSWGPTVFAIARDDTDAKRLVDWLSRKIEYQEHVIQIARPNNCGATIESHPSV
jgi:beta-ribofuranosylaminobenzene 5'-phosphate synthase